MRTTTAAIAAALLLAACHGDDKPVEPRSEPAAAEQRAQKTFLDTQKRALDKAKAVQGTVDDAAAKRDQELKDAGG